MTTARQVKQVYLPILERHSDLKATRNRFLCKTPVHHIVSRVFVERSSDANCCWPMWAVLILFVPSASIDISIGTYHERLKRPTTSSETLWLWSDPNMIDDAIDVIENVALPKLEFFGTPEGYATLPVREDWIHYEPREDRMLVHIAAGDLEAARAIWREKAPEYEGKSYPEDSLQGRWKKQLDAVGEPLIAGDRQALAKILHGWEAANVRGTSVERYWEPTPFPLEL